jgi:hypothetical protein
MGKRKFQEFLPDECHRRYCCVHCRAHLANHDELISKVCIRTLMYIMYTCEVQQYSLGSACVDVSYLPAVIPPQKIQSFQGSQGKAYLFNKV